MKTVEDRVEKVLTKMAKTKKAAVEPVSIKLGAIGNHVCSLIAKHGEISVASLIESLKHEIDSSPSARGEVRPEQDLIRLRAEAALEHVQAISKPVSG